MRIRTSNTTVVHFESPLVPADAKPMSQWWEASYVLLLLGSWLKHHGVQCEQRVNVRLDDIMSTHKITS